MWLIRHLLKHMVQTHWFLLYQLHVANLEQNSMSKSEYNYKQAMKCKWKFMESDKKDSWHLAKEEVVPLLRDHSIHIVGKLLKVTWFKEIPEFFCLNSVQNSIGVLLDFPLFLLSISSNMWWALKYSANERASELCSFVLGFKLQSNLKGRITPIYNGHVRLYSLHHKIRWGK